MAQVRVNPKSQNWPYLERGRYGPGCEFEASCEWVKLEVPATENPRYDEEGKEGPYAYVELRIDRPDKRPLTIRHYEPIGENSGSRLLGWLMNVGVDVADDGTFDDSVVPGRKIGVECGEARTPKNNPDRKFTTLRDVFGI